MATARDLLRFPTTYDIVVSDFGRDATIEYLGLVSALEKKFIRSILEFDQHEFFDEYRRIMYTVLADVAFFKASAIAHAESSLGYLTEDVLIGLGQTPMSHEFFTRVTLSVVQELIAAIERGHKRLRVAIPCNGLSDVAARIGRVLRSDAELNELANTRIPLVAGLERLASAEISVHTVPSAVMDFLRKERKPDSPIRVLALGTAGTNAIYQSLAQSCNIEILSLADDDYRLIDRSIVAAIGGDAALLESCRQELQKRVIDPRRTRFADLVVVEACTDFRLNLGLSSLELFARSMVADCYPRDSHD